MTLFTRLLGFAGLICLLVTAANAKLQMFWVSQYQHNDNHCELTTLVSGPRSDERKVADFWFGFYYFNDDLSVDDFEYDAGGTYLVLRFVNDSWGGDAAILPRSLTIDEIDPSQTTDHSDGPGLEFVFFSATDSGSILSSLVSDRNVSIDLTTTDGESVEVVLNSKNIEGTKVNYAMFAACIRESAG